LTYLHNRKPFADYLPSPHFTCSGNLTLFCFLLQGTVVSKPWSVPDTECYSVYEQERHASSVEGRRCM